LKKENEKLEAAAKIQDDPAEGHVEMGSIDPAIANGAETHGTNANEMKEGGDDDK
jgi:hypothetical protein